jgi:hypothetical protein
MLYFKTVMVKKLQLYCQMCSLGRNYPNTEYNNTGIQINHVRNFHFGSMWFSQLNEKLTIFISDPLRHYIFSVSRTICSEEQSAVSIYGNKY